MTMRTRQALVLALSVSATATALTAVTGPAAATAAPSSPTLTWRPCDRSEGPAGQECAELPVPLDYRTPDGPQLTLAVSRPRGENPEARRGTLLVIPGGPGGSGVKLLAQQGKALRREVGDAYDIVSLDPRGTGGSTRASCGLPVGDRHLVTLRSWPAPDGDITESVARSRRVAVACTTNGGAVLRSLTTANEVRDIDRFRQALGEERLSAYGVSYGTYGGAVYAQKYPERTDRWVLDGNDDPDPRRVARGWPANMARGVEDRFPDFAVWAADPAQESAGLRLAERPEDVRPLFLSLAAELDRAPRTTTTTGVPPDRQPAAAGHADRSLQRHLVRRTGPADTAGHGPEGDAGPDTGRGRADGDEDAAVTMAVICNDVRWPASVGTHERAAADRRARYPLTAGMPVNITPCSFWKEKPVWNSRPGSPTTGRPTSSCSRIGGTRPPLTPAP